MTTFGCHKGSVVLSTQDQEIANFVWNSWHFLSFREISVFSAQQGIDNPVFTMCFAMQKGNAKDYLAQPVIVLRQQQVKLCGEFLGPGASQRITNPWKSIYAGC